MEQEIQNVGNTLESVRSILPQQYFENFLPGLRQDSVVKVVIALLVFVGGRKVIQWIVYLIKTSMQKTSIDKGVIQFVRVSSQSWALCIAGIYHCHSFRGERVFSGSFTWNCRCNGRSGVAGRSGEYRRRDHAADI